MRVQFHNTSQSKKEKYTEHLIVICSFRSTSGSRRMSRVSGQFYEYILLASLFLQHDYFSWLLLLPVSLQLCASQQLACSLACLVLVPSSFPTPPESQNAQFAKSSGHVNECIFNIRVFSKMCFLLIHIYIYTHTTSPLREGNHPTSKQKQPDCKYTATCIAAV